MLAFRSLDPFRALRDLIAGDGTKNGLFRSEQRTVSTTQTTITDQLPSQAEKPLDRGKPHTSLVRTGGGYCHQPLGIDQHRDPRDAPRSSSAGSRG